MATNAHRTGYAVLAGFAAASMLDNMLAFNAVMGLVVAIAAWSLPVSAEPSHERTIPRSALLAGSGLLIALALPSIITVAAARWEAEGARSAFRSGDYQAAITGFVRAEALYPENAAYALGEGLARASVGENESAAAAYRRATLLAPGDPRAWGAAASLTSSRTERITDLRIAAEHSHLDAQYSLRLARELEQTGDQRGASEQYAVAVMLNPAVVLEIPSGTVRDAALRKLPEVVTRYGEGARANAAVVEAAVMTAMGEVADAAFPADQSIAYAEEGDRTAAVMSLHRAAEEDPHARSTWVAHVAVGWLLCDERAHGPWQFDASPPPGAGPAACHLLGRAVPRGRSG